MAITLTQQLIDLAHTKFATEWEKDWTQNQSRLQPYVSEIPNPQGKYYRFPRLGGTAMREYTSNDEDVTLDSLKVGDYGFKARKFHNEIGLNDDDNAEAYDLMMNLDLIRQQQAKAVLQPGHADHEAFTNPMHPRYKEVNKRWLRANGI